MNEARCARRPRRWPCRPRRASWPDRSPGTNSPLDLLRARLLAAPQIAHPGYRPPRCGARGVRRRTPRWCRQSRGWVCDDSDICGAEERRARGRARERATCSDSSRLSERSGPGSEASFATGHEAEHRREPFAKRRAAASERRCTRAAGFATLAAERGARRNGSRLDVSRLDRRREVVDLLGDEIAELAQRSPSTGVMPSSSKRLTIAGSATMSASALASLSVTSFGRPAGPETPK